MAYTTYLGGSILIISLIISAIIFGIGHIYITYQAGKVQEQKYEE
ncbi:MAG: hypothetical protein PUB13_08965 [Lachnospiraceae bacterium]|nr:hypothetical protein [Lachnospiraceae bacterium]